MHCVLLQRKRAYAAHLSRWISTDPTWLADGVNLYAYVNGNPVSGVDPSGTQTEEKVDEGKVFPTFEEVEIKGEGGANESILNQWSSSSSADISSASGIETESSHSITIDDLSINILKNMAKSLLPSIKNLSEEDKEIVFHEDTRGTIAILLYEFASGEGKQSRLFDEQNAITKDIMKLDFVQAAIEKFYDENLGKTDLQSINYSYRFSPSTDILHILNSIEQHGKAFSEIMSNGDWLRLFLGSTTIHVSSDEEKLVVTVVDSKSRNSWYYHIGVGIAQNTSRDSLDNEPLTTTTQTYVGSQNIDRLRLRLFNPSKSSSTASLKVLHK